MLAQVEIVNAALTLLGESRITSIEDEVKAARESKALWTIARNAIMAGYNWSFAMARSQLLALATAPAFGFSTQYLLPVDCLRITQIGDYFPGLDLTDYRGSSTEEYQIEGRNILTNIGAPLNFRFVRTVTDTMLFAPSFDMSFAAYLASLLAEPLTQSDQKRQRALDQLRDEIRLAIRANAIELPPRKLADDEWLMSRL